MDFNDFLNKESRKLNKPKYPKKKLPPKEYSKEEKDYWYSRIFNKSTYVDLRGIRKKYTKD